MPDAKIRKDLVKADPNDLPGHESEVRKNASDHQPKEKRKDSKHGQSKNQ